MRPSRRSIMTLLLWICVPAGLAPAAQEIPPQAAPAGNLPAVAQGGTQFALELYARVRAETKENICLSPFGASAALAMTSAGARADTAAQMAAALRLPAFPARPHRAFHQAIGALNTALTEPCALHLANALWVETRYPLDPDYGALVQRQYFAAVQTLDIAGDPEDARQTINLWTREKTKDKVPELLPAGLLTPETPLVLTNAVYFFGAWAYPFDKALTANSPFWIDTDTSVVVPMMTQTQRFPYTETTDGVQVLALPYGAAGLAMHIFLPRQADGLEALENTLSPAFLAQVGTAMSTEAEVAVSLPRFSLRHALSLANPLKALGMTDAFDSGRADFSGISPQALVGPRLFLLDVAHEACVNVNEQGTEAAATTAVVMTRKGIPDRDKLVVFRANHPFLFLIRHDPTGSILFMGRVSSPA